MLGLWFGPELFGGGGNAWDAMAYDLELNRLYIGPGNGSPWNYYKRSNGEGDHLFLSSVVALIPDTGKYTCHGVNVVSGGMVTDLRYL